MVNGRISLRILADMDDTIEQLLQAWVRAANEKYSRNTRYEDTVSLDVPRVFPGLTWEQVYSNPLEPGF